MNTVFFQNDWIIDPISIATFGVNSKESDNPIGYFGTGLKYAIAVLLREGCSITIKSDDNEYLFKKVNRNIRGKEFDIVHMNDEPIGFTTELGKNWDIWCAFRELYCNAIDEGGVVSDDYIGHQAGKTTVEVRGDRFHREYLDMDKNILSTKPFIENKLVSLHPGRSNRVFYKSIRIHDSQKMLLNNYNIKLGLDITEDRTAKYPWQINDNLVDFYVELKDENLISAVLLADPAYHESGLDFCDLRADPSDEFLSIVEDLRLNPKVNKTAITLLGRLGRGVAPTPVDLDNIQQQQLDIAKSFCKEIGYDVESFPIIATGELKNGLMGLAEKGGIYISIEAFGMGTKYIASTLIEEYLHIKTGYGDMTRELQNLLFNDIVSLGEKFLGRPI